jgi:hypothetical protein
MDKKPLISISQEYFDEVCLDNAGIFELNEVDALQETIDQLRVQGSLDHLSLTFPTSKEGLEARDERSRVLTLIEDLNVSRNHLDKALREVKDILDSGRTHQLDMFLHHQGVEALVESSLGIAASDLELFDVWLQNILQLIAGPKPDKSSIQAFQLAMPEVMPYLLGVHHCLLQNGNRSETLVNLLRIMTWSTKQCEVNKKTWMQLENEGADFLQILMETMDSCLIGDNDTWSQDVGHNLCRFVTSLCTFDDFQSPNKSSIAAPTIASTHANVQAFAARQIVPKLHLYLQRNNDSAGILCLRALAVQDGIVQSMVAVGILEMTKAMFKKNVNLVADSEETLQMLTAIIGLFRNLSANDEIKTTLCIGNQSVLGNLLQAMEKYPSAASLQEHACGTLAAMALREPKNAEYLVGHDAHTWIVRAMRNHPQRSVLQRQAALALRNLVSRSPELRPNVLQTEAEVVLRTIAAKHASCQDEVYAALRDLGLPVSRMQVEHDASGEVVLRPTQMFGDAVNTRFRAVFE